MAQLVGRSFLTSKIHCFNSDNKKLSTVLKRRKRGSLVKWWLPTPEVRGSNSIIGKIYIERLPSTALKKQRKKGDGNGLYKKYIISFYFRDLAVPKLCEEPGSAGHGIVRVVVGGRRRKRPHPHELGHSVGHSVRFCSVVDVLLAAAVVVVVVLVSGTNSFFVKLKQCRSTPESHIKL